MLAEKSKNWHLSGPGKTITNYSFAEGIEGKGRDYQNASRSFVRLVWFLDFVYEMVFYMREHPNVFFLSFCNIGYTSHCSEICLQQDLS